MTFVSSIGEAFGVYVLRKHARSVRSGKWNFVGQQLYASDALSEAIFDAEEWARASSKVMPRRAQVLALEGNLIDARKTRECRRRAWEIKPLRSRKAVGK